MKVFFVADNRTRPNWGCRGTSIALKSLIERDNEIIHTIYGDTTYAYAPFYYRKGLWGIFFKILWMIKFIRPIIKLFDCCNVVKEDVDKSCDLFERASKRNDYFANIKSKIEEADAIVVNGEGSFIFSTPHRYDTLIYLMYLRLGQRYGKKTYCLNSMFSDAPNSGRNNDVIIQCKKVFANCTRITARDPLSFEYFHNYLGDNVEYVPDALFTWTKYNNYVNLQKDYPMSMIPFPEMDKSWNDFVFPDHYICLTGSSGASKNKSEAKSSFLALAKALSSKWNLVVVSCCKGDDFLRDVAEQLSCPYIPVETNIIAGMCILQNADVFVTGRWHPAILASNGGTPCVFMGSNSSKTKAIQYMLEYSNVVEYSCFPTNDDICSIVESVSNIIENLSMFKTKFYDKSSKLSNLAFEGNKL